MPATLRRVASTCITSPNDCPTTPPKKRRIRVTWSNQESEKFAITTGEHKSGILCGTSSLCNQSAEKANLFGNDGIFFASDVCPETPIKDDRSPTNSECVQRMMVCAEVRVIVRALFLADSVDDVKQKTNRCLITQIMACHYVQVFSAFTTLATENLAAVAEAAASLALIMSDCCCSCSMDDAMQSCNKVRADDVSVSQVMQRMRDDLDLVQTHCISASVFEMLLAELDNTIDCFLQKLPDSQAFQASPIIVTDVVLKAKLASTSRSFLADGMMGQGALLLSPLVLAAGSLVLASQYVLRQAGAEMSSDELHGMVAAAVTANKGCVIESSELGCAVEHMVSIARLWNESSSDDSPKMS